MTRKNFLNLAIEPEIQAKLKKYAEVKDLSPSRVVRDLIDKYLGDEEVIPVILKVPVNLRGDRENLQKWVSTRAIAIVNKLANV
jgi:hypothetical protein